MSGPTPACSDGEQRARCGRSRSRSHRRRAGRRGGSRSRAAHAGMPGCGSASRRRPGPTGSTTTRGELVGVALKDRLAGSAGVRASSSARRSRRGAGGQRRAGGSDAGEEVVMPPTGSQTLMARTCRRGSRRARPASRRRPGPPERRARAGGHLDRDLHAHGPGVGRGTRARRPLGAHATVAASRDSRLVGQSPEHDVAIRPSSSAAAASSTGWR